MEVRDSELQEYLSEIYNWYNVKVSIGRLNDIFKDLGYTNRKVLPVICRLTLACQRSWTVRSRTQGCLGSKNCAVEPWAGDFSWWIRGQCSFWGTNTSEGAKRSNYSVPSSFPKVHQLQHPPCNDNGWLHRMSSLFWGRQRGYIQCICRKWTAPSLQRISRPKFNYCHG